MLFFVSKTSINTKFTPSWKKYEKDLHGEDPNLAFKAGEAFDEERSFQMKNDAKARRWEASRKEELQKEKIIWKKDQIKKEELNKQRIINELRDGGHLNKNLKPAPGLILIQDKKHINETNTGIYLPDQVEYESRISTVLKVGEPRQAIGSPETVPCKENDEVLVRKGAGLNLKINNQPVFLIRYDEVLGVLE